MSVLVAYGSTGGGTAEIAAWIAGQLRAEGLAVHLEPAAEISTVDDYDAVVLGSALYAHGWHVDVRRFVHRFAGRFTDRPVWLFSSGPLDRSADTGPVPPIHHAEAALRDLPAREHVTFGGRMTTEAHGWLGRVAGQLAREGHAGDFRNPERVRAWASRVAADIRSVPGRDIRG
ncbi:flavodoxin domain-containing protein [Actinoplanes sp. NPDC049265]|uniref:flavodoxin domain-containing protein n=1 Tax=Actinoplanes sp. NPDC049265 TaxID=3363902 RepID=UPI003719C94C